MRNSTLAKEVTKEVLTSITPLLEKVRGDVLASVTPMFREVKTEVFTSVAPLFEELKIKFLGLEKKFDKIELKVSGLGIQMDQMNSKIDLALELATAIPELEDTTQEHGHRLKKVEIDIKVIKLVQNRSEE